MAAALAWGSLAASSLVLGALLAFARRWLPIQIGLVLAFGAGALISAVSFELTAEALAIGDQGAAALGLAAGAFGYYLLDGLIAGRTRSGRGMPGRAAGTNAGSALALGAFLDGVPEQLVLGINLAAGEGISAALLVAIFVSNLPEAIGSANEMKAAGTSRERILGLWIAVATVCALASAVGYGVADATSSNLRAGIDGFAAGALLVMLIDSMIPVAVRNAGRPSGLVTVLGFALGAWLSSVG